MYKHILIPTDGSELSDKAIEAGIEFAREVNARVTGFTAVPEYRIPSQVELMAKHGVSMPQYEEDMRRQAGAALHKISERARAAGVACDTDFVQNDSPHEAIVAAAESHGCDLIFMASHGRSGISALIHGSETQGVLAHSRIPTLVYR
jgi:nucleotide-binding universal stress UspA family protein